MKTAEISIGQLLAGARPSHAFAWSSITASSTIVRLQRLGLLPKELPEIPVVPELTCRQVHDQWAAEGEPYREPLETREMRRLGRAARRRRSEVARRARQRDDGGASKTATRARAVERNT